MGSLRRPPPPADAAAAWRTPLVLMGLPCLSRPRAPRAWAAEALVQRRVPHQTSPRRGFREVPQLRARAGDRRGRRPRLQPQLASSTRCRSHDSIKVYHAVRRYQSHATATDRRGHRRRRRSGNSTRRTASATDNHDSRPSGNDGGRKRSTSESRTRSTSAIRTRSRSAASADTGWSPEEKKD